MGHVDEQELQEIIQNIETTKNPDDLKAFAKLDVAVIRTKQFEALVNVLETKMLNEGLKGDFEPNALGIALDNLIGELHVRRRSSN